MDLILDLPRPSAAESPLRFSIEEEEQCLSVDDEGIVSSPMQREKWADSEINYVRTWCKKEIRESKSDRNIVARCLKHIKANADVLKIFHPNHVTNSSRLYYRYKTYNKNKF